MTDHDLDALDALLEQPAQPAEQKEEIEEPGDLVQIDEEDEALEEALERSEARRLPDEVGDDGGDFLESFGIKRARSVPDRSEPWMEHHKFTLVTSIEQLNQIIDECIRRGFCSLDLETEGLDNRIQYRQDGSPETVHKIVGYCISYDGVEGFYVPVRHKPADDGPDLNLKPLEEVEGAITRLCRAAIPEGTAEDKAADPLSFKCEPPKLVICFWNAQFDQEFLYPVTGIDWWHPSSFEDGMLACFCVYAGDKRIGLKPKAAELLRDPNGNPYTMIELKELFFGKTKNIRFAALAPDEPGLLRYAGSDAICTYLLCQLKTIVPVCHQRHAFTYRLEKQTSNAIRVMERARVRINREHVRHLLQEQEEQKAQLLTRIRHFSFAARHYEVDPNSPKQLSEFLFGPKPKGLDISPKPEKNAASGQYKTDGETLEGLAKRPNAPSILKDIVRYREVDKFIGTYLLGLSQNPDENDEIRVSFKQTGAASGRFSAPAGMPEHGYAGVPVHGIPRESDIRRDFVAREGFTLIKADYAGEELRIAANVAQEPVWINEFLNGTGDLHTISARALFGKQDISKEERSAAKTVNFNLLYGGGPKAIVRETGCDEMEARRRKQAFDKAIPTLAAWMKEQHRKVKEQLGVYTAFGRWLALPDAKHEDRAIQAAVERHATNYQIQGAGADIMKIALVMLTKKFHKQGWLKNGGDDSVRMLLTVHDEVVFEVRHDRVAEVVPIIVDVMEQPWRMPQKPKWVVPLVVEPLVGFNWKSGYAAERAKTKRHLKDGEIHRIEQGIPLRKYEVLMNGFIYSTTREPKKDKATKQIVEALDRQEVVDGDVFRVVDAPWLVGAGSVPGNDSSPPGNGTPTPDLVEPARPAVEFEGGSTVEAQAEGGTAVSGVAVNHGILRLSLERLSQQTADQVCQLILGTIDNDDGWDLHLTDLFGATLVGPGRFRVNKERFIDSLRDRHLLCEADLDETGTTA